MSTTPHEQTITRRLEDLNERMRRLHEQAIAFGMALQEFDRALTEMRQLLVLRRTH